MTDRQLTTMGSVSTEVSEIDPAAVQAAFRLQSDNMSSLLQRVDSGANRIMDQIVPLVVFAIANADNDVDQNEVEAFMDLFRFSTATRVFRSELLLLYFKNNDARKSAADIGSLKLNENTRHRTDVFEAIESNLFELVRLIGPDGQTAVRNDFLVLCYLIANSSGSSFELEGNISDEEKYAASKIRMIIDRAFGYSSEEGTITSESYAIDNIEKFAFLFKSEFDCDPSILEISAFVFCVFYFLLNQNKETPSNASSNGISLDRINEHFGFLDGQLPELIKNRSAEYIELLVASFRSFGTESESEDMNHSMMFAMALYRHATELSNLDMFRCLTVLAPEMHAFVTQTADFISKQQD
ncbi:MAG: hypothetical protein ACR2O8_16800 [Rhizobiaceae bacterium]